MTPREGYGSALREAAQHPVRVMAEAAVLLALVAALCALLVVLSPLAGGPR